MMLLSAALAAAVVAPPAPPPAAPPAPLASLRVELEEAAMQAMVADAGAGPTLRIGCVRGCARPVAFTDATGDAPLGLFVPFDAVPVLMSTWSSGSAYRVRAYRLTIGGVERVLNAASLAAPGVMVTPEGRLRVVTTALPNERAARGAARPVAWEWRDGRFARAGTR